MGQRRLNLKLDDHSSFPFGKWKGTAMGAVPTKYLLWFRKQPWADEWPAVVEYIERNTQVLETQAKFDAEKHGEQRLAL